MITVQILIIGQSIATIVTNLIGNLNLIQQEFSLEINEKPNLSAPRKKGVNWISTETVIEIAKRELGAKYISDYVIVICDQQLEEDEFIWASEIGFGVISTYTVTKESMTFSLEKYLAYLTAGLLLGFYVDTPIHYESRGCVGDYCENPKDIYTCVARCDVCRECRSLILQSVGKGDVTLSIVASIYKILDYAGNRKICFVVMPFSTKFRSVYEKCIKPALIEHRWLCMRADEIYESREIPHLIWEQILRADLIVAELTSANPNVLYELGYAHALARNTILITQDEKSVPFDLRHRQIINYSQTPGGLRKLGEGIRKRLEEI